MSTTGRRAKPKTPRTNKGALTPTHNAYRTMLAEPGIQLRLGRAMQSVLNLRYRMTQGEYPSLNTMRSHLAKAGWRLGTEERWRQVRDLSVREAYTLVLFEPRLPRRYGMAPQRITAWRTELTQRGWYPSEERMRALLAKAGWNCIAEENWVQPATKQRKGRKQHVGAAKKRG